MHPLSNQPDLWRQQWRWPHPEGHKYDRGHVIVCGGQWQCTGAAKLAAYGALRSGAGLVSIVCDAQTLPLYAPSLQAVMTKLVETQEAFAAWMADVHVRAALIGPGAGVNAATKERVLTILKAGKPAVLDADALRVFSDAPERLFEAIHSPAILTPHAGEFAALFGPVGERREAQVCDAAARSGAVVVLKGPRSLIAAPDGRLVVNDTATPFLATAGSGDVLAGIAAGLLAQGMPAFEAACAAVWMHSEAGNRVGPGLIAEDLPAMLPEVLRALYIVDGRLIGVNSDPI